MNKNNQLQEQVLYTKGLHCASCEVLVEQKLLKLKDIKAVDAMACENKVRIEYRGKLPSLDRLNRLFSKDGYQFGFKPFSDEEGRDKLFCYDRQKRLVLNRAKLFSLGKSSSIFLLLVVLFLLLNRSGLSALLNVDSQSALPAFLVFGLLAGFSTCSALIGGIILSMSSQWFNLYAKDNSFLTKLQPHLLFNVGRLVSYFVLGGLLGWVGGIFQPSLTFTSFLTIAVSLLMLFLGLQMLGVKGLQSFQLRLPKVGARFISDETNFKGRFLPLLMGGLTFFLPCGFTLTAQSLALVSGSFWQAGLIMLIFALGTLPALSLISFSSVKFMAKKKLAQQFVKIAGALVLFFAFFNLNAQFNLLGLPSFSDVAPILSESSQVQDVGQEFPEVIDGKQIIKITATSYAYTPNLLTVKAGVPVRLEVKDEGTSGCTNAIIAKDLFPGEIKLTPGKVSVKEFTPQLPGRYKFSCWMGMVSGVIEVVDDTGSTGQVDKTVEVGQTGCGVGCNGSCGGGCGNSGCSLKK